MKLRASAPGKLLLLGEYAVLEGAPALVMAVDRRAVAELTASEDSYSVFAPEVHPQPVTFSMSADGAPQWHDPTPELTSRFSLVVQVMQALAAQSLLPANPFHLRLDSAAFFHHAAGSDTAVPSKLGLGSSAAMTTALASVLVAFAGHRARIEDRAAWLRTLLQIHRQFQGGRGSGADVAAAVHGGIIRFQLDPLDKATPQVMPLHWPAQLQRLWVWSGQSASTSSFLNTLEHWRDEQPCAYAQHMAELTAIAAAGATAAAADDALSLRQALAAAAVALHSLGEASKIPIFSDGHRRIAEVADAAGGIYKPCGAGGGDLGLAVADDAAVVGGLCAALAAAGHVVLDIGVDHAGLVLEQVARLGG